MADSLPSARDELERVHWLRRTRRIHLMIRWLGIAVAALLVLVCLGGLLVFGWAASMVGPDATVEMEQLLGRLGWLLALAGLGTLMLLPPVFSSLCVLKRQIGSDGRKLHIRLEDGRQIAIAPEKLSCTDRTLLYRRYAIPIKDGRMNSLYEDGEIKAYVAPLLQRSQQLGPIEALRYRWRNRDRQLMWSLASLVSLLVMVGVMSLLL